MFVWIFELSVCVCVCEAHTLGCHSMIEDLRCVFFDSLLSIAQRPPVAFTEEVCGHMRIFHNPGTFL